MQTNSRKAGRPYKQKQKQAADAKAKVPGRKEKDGTGAVIKLEILRAALPNLIDLTIRQQQARATYNEAVTAVAESAGLLAATVSKFVKARAGDNFLEDKAKAQQLALCFEELGPLDDHKAATHPSELFEGQDPDDEDADEQEDEAGATVTHGEQRPAPPVH